MNVPSETKPSLKDRIFTKKTLIIAGIVLVVGVVAGLNIYRYSKTDAITVKTSAVTEKKLVETVLSSGKVITENKEIIYSQVVGTVKHVRVALGESVKPGQVLMELDVPDAEQRLMQARSTLASAQANLAKAQAGNRSIDVIDAETAYAQAKSDYEKARDTYNHNSLLYTQGAVSKDELEASRRDMSTRQAVAAKAEASMITARQSAASSLTALQASVNSARASLAVIERLSSQKGLAAGISGKVLSIQADDGDMVATNSPLITIGDIDKLEVKADISEADAAKLRLGQKTTITSTALPDETYTGRIKEIGLEAVAKTKNQTETTAIPVIISINRGSMLRPGFNVDLEIVTAREAHAVVAPYDAVIEKGGKPCVYVVKSGKAELRHVKTGLTDNLNIQIKQGLKKGDKVIINPPRNLKNGSLVDAK